MVKKKIDAIPDNSYIERDGGFYFTAWGVHVAANDLDSAKEHVKEYHGIDVDNDVAPPKQVKSEG